MAIITATTGLLLPRATFVTLSRMSIGLESSGVTLTTITMSIPSSSSSVARARAYSPSAADAIMSTGLPTLASAGRKEARVARVCSENVAISSPRLTQASVAMMAGPPALVTMPTRLPAGSGQRSSARTTPNSSSMVLARITPHCRRNADTVTSAPAIAPVWLVAARAPSAVRPDLTTRMGFLRLTRLAISVNLRGLPKDSRYMQMTRVSGSSSQYSARSLAETSALLPIEANWVRPMPRSEAALRIATPSAPDWLTKPTVPGWAGVGAKVALSATPASVLITPMQLGPTMRTPATRTRSRTRRSSSAPLAPVSAKPAVITTRPRTPASMHSSTTPSTRSRGTITTARSIGSGTSLTRG